MGRTICSLVAAAFLAGSVVGCKSGPNDDEYIFIDRGVPNQASRERLHAYDQSVKEGKEEYDGFVRQMAKYSGNGVDFHCLGPIEAKQILANLDVYRKALPEGVTITSDYNPDEGTLKIRPSEDYQIDELKLVDGLKVDIKYCFYNSPGCNLLLTKANSS